MKLPDLEKIEEINNLLEHNNAFVRRYKVFKDNFGVKKVDGDVYDDCIKKLLYTSNLLRDYVEETILLNEVEEEMEGVLLV